MKESLLMHLMAWAGDFLFGMRNYLSAFNQFSQTSG